MENKCPECNKKHRLFPRQCYYTVHADYTHCVIAKLASLGNYEQKEFDKQSKLKWNAMEKYVESNFPKEIK